MDMDDDDAFLYGDEQPAPAVAAAAAAQPPAPAEAPKPEVKPESSLSASMAASLAAYGIDPSTAVAAENPEDGGVEEEDPEDDDESDSEDDDVKVVFNTGQQRLDLRKPQTQPSNIIGVGKWAHSSTGAAAPAATPTPAPATPRVVAPTANQTTEYTPASRPGMTPTPSGATSAVQAPLANPPIPPSGDEGTAPNVALPASSLPPVTANGASKIDPENPSGIIPSTGNSTYDIDVSQFEGSGQPWRRVGSDIQDWFNFGFDEVTYPKFLRYRQEMEAGRAALMNLPMGGMNPEIAQLLHLPNPMMAMQLGNNMDQMNQLAQMHQMAQMAQMGNMAQMGFNSQQMQAMQQMGMGMEGMMQQHPQQFQQQFQQQQQQMQNQQPFPQQGQPPRPASQRASATPAPVQANAEAAEEVKQEEGAEGPSAPTAPEGPRGQVPMRGMPAGRGAPMRGRGGVIPSGPRAGVPLPGNVPKGPKAGRFRDKDRVENSTSDLNYGDEESAYPASANIAGGAGSRESLSPSRSERRERERSRRRDRSPDEEYRARSRSRSRSASPARDRDRDRERSRRSSRRYDDDGYDSRDRDRDRSKREKRKRDDAGDLLGPGGWQSDEEETRPRRRKSYDSEEEDRYSRRSKRR